MATKPTETVDDCEMEVPTPVVAPTTTEGRAKIFAALSDPTRLSIVETLVEKGEMSSTAIANELGISLALLCHHSKILMEAGVLQMRKSGQTKFRSVDCSVVKACLDSLTD